VTSGPTAAQDLRDLARLRRARDRIDREYAQPLDVEALALPSWCAARRLSAPGGACDGGMPSCVARQVTRPIRNREAPVPSRG